MYKNVDDYIENQNSPQKEICQELRQIIKEAIPDVEEKMKWGVPTYAGGKYYLVALKDHVNMGFSIGTLSKEEVALFEGTGKTMRHVRFSNPDNIDNKKVVSLMKMVV